VEDDLTMLFRDWRPSQKRGDVRTILIFLVSSCLLAFAVHARDVYMWTDETGRKHFSDAPPPDPKIEVKSFDAKKSELTDAQKRELEQRLARDKAWQQSMQAKPSATAANKKSPIAQQAASGAASAQDSSPNSQSECALAWKKYNESYACLDAYRVKRGGIKAEGFDHCQQVARPENCK
jgi:Domain of unknown function (DUF4124)